MMANDSAKNPWRNVVGTLGEMSGANGEKRGESEELKRRAEVRESEELKRRAEVTTIFVAVHGIGDHFRFETIQSVAHQVCHYVGEPAAIPLGRYHTKFGEIYGAYLPNLTDPGVKCGFTEIYWANIPRELVKENYVLEDARRWARLLVSRLGIQARQEMKRALRDELGKLIGCLISNPGKVASTADAKKCFDSLGVQREPTPELINSLSQLNALDEVAFWKDPKVEAQLAKYLKEFGTDTRDDDKLLEQILEEVIQIVRVGDRLSLIASLAGFFKFDLNRLLSEYVNDVQVVTEFENYRSSLLSTFDSVMNRVKSKHTNKDLEIYLIAHSEGTVIGFLGLLEGMNAGRAWAENVRGFMTLGSPLNKHLRLWPELFPRPEPGIVERFSRRPIQWRNYYDFGDPVGFDLEPTRDWLSKSTWVGDTGGKPGVFDFRPDHDIGFTRSPLPGAAHTAYWSDSKVFSHFLSTVVDPLGQTLKPVDPNLVKAASLVKQGPSSFAVLRGLIPKVAVPAKPNPNKDDFIKANDVVTRPEDRPFAEITSYVLPYLLSAVLLILGVYVLYKAVRYVLDPAGAALESPKEILRDVLGLSGLIAGMTLLARIPRLTRRADAPLHWIYELRFIILGRLMPNSPKAWAGTAWRMTPEALSAMGWRGIACLTSLFSLAYFAVEPSNRTSLERIITDPASVAIGWHMGSGTEHASIFKRVIFPVIDPFFENLRPCLRHEVIAHFWIFLGLVAFYLIVKWKVRLLRPLVRTLVPTLLVLVAMRVGFAFTCPTDEPTSFTCSVMDLAQRAGSLLRIPAGQVHENAVFSLLFAVLASVAIGSLILIHMNFQERLASQFLPRRGARLAVALLSLAIFAATYALISHRVEIVTAQMRVASMAIIALAWTIGYFCWRTGRRYPELGLSPLIRTGGMIAGLIIIVSLTQDPSSRTLKPSNSRLVAQRLTQLFELESENLEKKVQQTLRPDIDPAKPLTPDSIKALQELRSTALGEMSTIRELEAALPQAGPIWPVVPAAALFFYLWWMAVLTFDLTFIWHLYIRYGGARDYFMDRIQQAEEQGKQTLRGVIDSL